MKKEFASTKCDYSTDNRKDFERHCVTHTGVKTYKCDTCGKFYSTKSSLSQHIRSIHTKENEYECDVCEKVYYRRSELLQYVKVILLKLF